MTNVNKAANQADNNQAVNNQADPNQADPNAEWQLSDLVDAIAAEIDRSHDTLSLKSYARGLSFAVKTLSLNLEVKMRRDQDGKLLFRTVTTDQTSDTVLKLDFAQVLQNQLTQVRKPLDSPLSLASADNATLEALPTITQMNIAALNALSIYSIDELRRYTQTPQMIVELSRKAGIEESQIRRWQNLPFITAVKPASGAPGSVITIEGGNFGAQPQGIITFQQQQATIRDWQETRLTVEMPAGVVGTGAIVVQVDQQRTNPVAWEAIAADLQVLDLQISPAELVEGEDITAVAELVNRGKADAVPFEVQWEVDGIARPPQLHSPLRAQQQSQESVLQGQFRAGPHILRFTIDPNHKRSDLTHKNHSFTKQIHVRALQQLSLGDFRSIDILNPLFNTQLGPADVLSLLFRGLGRLHPETGVLIPDVASAWEIRAVNGNLFLLIQLPKTVYFHNNQPLTASDVVSTYKMAAQINAFWQDMINHTIRGIKAIDNTTVAFQLQTTSQAENAELLQAPDRSLKAGHPLTQLLTLGILPKTYENNPAQFNQHPIGSGPFQLQAFAPGESIQLRAFEKFTAGRPRFDRIDIRLGLDDHQLVKLISAQEINAAALPFSEPLVEQLRDATNCQFTVLNYPVGPIAQVQTLQIHERQPNLFDTNWNAHLWYDSGAIADTRG